ncbi:MAG: DNA-binding protein [Ruminococcus sp.]|nr:DNA-binding protein [Ruminococcus sp.]
MNIDKLISITQLRSEQKKEIAGIIGIEAYRKLVEDYGGSHVYVCKADTFLREPCNNEIEIYSQFNGFNYRDFAKKYNLSLKTIKEIVSEKMRNY